MKIEKKHMDISIQASVCYNLLQQIILDDQVFQYVGEEKVKEAEALKKEKEEQELANQ